jgi:hypothetical protein
MTTVKNDGIITSEQSPDTDQSILTHWIFLLRTDD